MNDMDKMKKMSEEITKIFHEHHKKTMQPKTSLLEDLEDLVGNYQRDKVSKKQVIETLESIVKYEKGEK